MADEIKVETTEAPKAEIPKAKEKRGNTIYIAIIAVLATLLLIVVGLFAFGRIVFLPSGAQFRGGPGTFGQGRQMIGPDGQPLSEEEMQQRRQEFEQNGGAPSGQGQGQGQQTPPPAQ